ncbi:maltokinase N-terminal cap-like domain-containing protein [Angustibacter peucedani]
MAVHHPATIVPTKQQLLEDWVPRQPWASGVDTSTLTRLGAYRFDDPDGEVGVETHLVGTAGGQVLRCRSPTGARP